MRTPFGGRVRERLTAHRAAVSPGGSRTVVPARPVGDGLRQATSLRTTNESPDQTADGSRFVRRCSTAAARSSCPVSIGGSRQEGLGRRESRASEN
jgi:hypothetical protein